MMHGTVNIKFKLRLLSENDDYVKLYFFVILLLQLFARIVHECHPILSAAREAYFFAVIVPRPQKEALRMVKIVALQASQIFCCRTFHRGTSQPAQSACFKVGYSCISADMCKSRMARRVLTYLLTYLLSYLLTYLLHGAESFLRS